MVHDATDIWLCDLVSNLILVSITTRISLSLQLKQLLYKLEVLVLIKPMCISYCRHYHALS